MAVSTNRFFGPAGSRNDYAPLLRWLLLNCLLAFAVVTLWYFGLIQIMLETDRTKISLLILGIFVLTDIHCLVQTVAVSRDLKSARRVSEILDGAGSGVLRREGERVLVDEETELRSGVMTSHIARLITKAAKLKGARLDQTLLLRILADRLRSREKLGWFVSEALLRLALLGTAVGFILMLVPISQVTSFDPETLRKALAGMSGGMAIALNVTVTGIAAALVLKFEYYLLDGATNELFNLITEVTEVQVVPALERADVRA